MIKILSIILLLSFKCLIAQNENKLELTGDLKTDSKLIINNTTFKQNISLSFNNINKENKKSPLLAGILSVLIPGAGEFYSHSYLKSVIFLTLEAGLIAVAIIYNNKGDNKTEEFQNFADNVTDNSGWSVVRYANWINQFKGKNIRINPNTNLKPWERVDWNELNAVERSITGFSHTLAQHGEQQYYEMIGKYYQFSPGWWDYKGGANNSQISPGFSYYSGLRGKANDLYNVSTKAVVGIYINHFISALDAVWSAVRFNKDLELKLRLDAIEFSSNYEMFPALYLKYHL